MDIVKESPGQSRAKFWFVFALFVLLMTLAYGGAAFEAPQHRERQARSEPRVPGRAAPAASRSLQLAGHHRAGGRAGIGTRCERRVRRFALVAELDPNAPVMTAEARCDRVRSERIERRLQTVPAAADLEDLRAVRFDLVHRPRHHRPREAERVADVGAGPEPVCGESPEDGKARAAHGSRVETGERPSILAGSRRRGDQPSDCAMRCNPSSTRFSCSRNGTARRGASAFAPPPESRHSSLGWVA